MLLKPLKRSRPGPPRIAVLTSIETRHRYFANAMRRNFDLAAVIYAPPTYRPADVMDGDLLPAERAVVAEHFAERSRQEQAFFGHDCAWVESGLDCAVRRIEPGRMNSRSTVEFLETGSIDTVLVFGTDLIKPPVLAPDRWLMINLHLGLSPYYRGTATNFYPLLNGEPQFVGATIHVLDEGIDAGPILQHARPILEVHDRPHTIGCKAISAGIEAMIAVVAKRVRGEPLQGVPQWTEPGSRLYLRRDYHPRQVVELYKKWGTGRSLHDAKIASVEPRLIGEPRFFSAAWRERNRETAFQT